MRFSTPTAMDTSVACRPSVRGRNPSPVMHFQRAVSANIRVDGRKIHPAYLFGVKKPAESRASFDYYKLVGTTQAEDAFRSMAEGGCPLV